NRPDLARPRPPATGRGGAPGRGRAARELAWHVAGLAQPLHQLYRRRSFLVAPLTHASAHRARRRWAGVAHHPPPRLHHLLTVSHGGHRRTPWRSGRRGVLLWLPARHGSHRGAQLVVRHGQSATRVARPTGRDHPRLSNLIWHWVGWPVRTDDLRRAWAW